MCLGMLAAIHRGSVIDTSLSTVFLAVTALPEFVIGIVLVIVFASVLIHALPAVAIFPPGESAWDEPRMLVLPVATLVIVIVPYIFRMMRATMVEALESDFVEMARLKGQPTWRIVLVHALPNAIPPTIQVVGLTFLYLAGGIVLVENVFSFPGLGAGLVDAVSDRDIPVIQFTVLLLASFYVVVNMLTDAGSLLATPRRRFAR
jgi:peptide/nickel transport system permease protein